MLFQTNAKLSGDGSHLIKWDILHATSRILARARLLWISQKRRLRCRLFRRNVCLRLGDRHAVLLCDFLYAFNT